MNGTHLKSQGGLMKITRCKKISYSIQGTDEDVSNFHKALLQLSNSQGIKIQKIENNNCNLLDELSKNQKEILDSAQKF